MKMVFRRNEQATRWRGLSAALLVGLAICATSLAEEQHRAAEASHEHGFHKNTIAGFIGFTGEDDRHGGEGRERALTLGLEYERRFSESWGVLVSAERALGDLDFTVITVPLVYHRGPWAFSAGPGIEIPSDKHEDEFVFRVAGTYAFDRGSYELVPKVGLDFVASEVVFFAGLVIGYGF
jgi:hypothetical protein